MSIPGCPSVPCHPSFCCLALPLCHGHASENQLQWPRGAAAGSARGGLFHWDGNWWVTQMVCWKFEKHFNLNSIFHHAPAVWTARLGYKISVEYLLKLNNISIFFQLSYFGWITWLSWQHFWSIKSSFCFLKKHLYSPVHDIHTCKTKEVNNFRTQHSILKLRRTEFYKEVGKDQKWNQRDSSTLTLFSSAELKMSSSDSSWLLLFMKSRIDRSCK